MKIGSPPHTPPQVIWCSSFLAAKGHASTRGQCCATHKPKNATQTTRLMVLRGTACCHAFCFRCVIPHGSSCVLQTHLVQSSYITLHCASFVPNAHVHYVWVISKHTRNAYNHKLHSLQTLHSLRYIPFHSVLLHSASLQSTRCPCCARLRCRSGCGLSCFLYPDLLANAHAAPFNKPTQKQKDTPALVRCSRSAQEPTPHSARLSS